MAIRIPLVVDFNGKGLQQMRKEFAQLDGAAAKTKFALQKAFLPATAVLGGFALAGKQAVEAAIADQKAQVALAKVLETTVGATKEQVAAVEDYIDATQKALTFTDDDLRPAFAKLARVTGDVTQSQKYLNLAMDVAIGTGKDLNSVTDVFAKALGGNEKALGRLFPEVRDMISQGATLDDVFQNLSETFGGSAAAAAGTVEGRMQILRTRFSELQEEIGARLLPIIEKYLLPAFEKITLWAEKNPGLIKAVALAFASLTGAVVALNIAMMLNPAVLLVAAFIGLIGYTVYLWKTNERFRETLQGVWRWMKKIYDMALDLIDPLKKVANLLTKLPSPGGLGNLIPDLTPGFDIPRVPFLADGGIVTRPTLAMIGEGGESEAVIPLSRLRDMGGRGQTTVNINVTSADPRAVVDALVRWSRQNGTLPTPVRVA